MVLIEEYRNENYVLVSGFAQTPKGIPAHEAYKYIGVILLIDKRTHKIVKADFSVIFSELTKRFLCEWIEGFCVNEPIHKLSTSLKEVASIPSIGAIIQSIRAAIERYKEHIKYYEKG